MRVKINLARVLDLIRALHPSQNLDCLYEIDVEPVGEEKKECEHKTQTATITTDRYTSRCCHCGMTLADSKINGSIKPLRLCISSENHENNKANGIECDCYKFKEIKRLHDYSTSSVYDDNIENLNEEFDNIYRLIREMKNENNR